MSRFNYRNKHKKALYELSWKCQRMFDAYVSAIPDNEVAAAKKIAKKINQFDEAVFCSFRGVILEAFRNDDCDRGGCK